MKERVISFAELKVTWMRKKKRDNDTIDGVTCPSGNRAVLCCFETVERLINYFESSCTFRVLSVFRENHLWPDGSSETFAPLPSRAERNAVVKELYLEIRDRDQFPRVNLREIEGVDTAMMVTYNFLPSYKYSVAVYPILHEISCKIICNIIYILFNI